MLNSFRILNYTRFLIVLMGLNLINFPLAIGQTLGGDNFIEQFKGAGFLEVSSSPQIKVFFKAFNHLAPVAPQQTGPAEPIRLTVYIEGDGAAWRVRQTPPRDPTPQNPIAAYLALADSGAFVAYMGRPCMYLDRVHLQQCPNALWTDARFSGEALALSNKALNDLIERFKKEALFEPSRTLLINLVGYSGGGVLAALLASQRSDVACLTTLASPLDIEVWAKLQRVAPLSRSLNPAYPETKLSQVQQMHWYGAEDRIVPPQSLGRYHDWSPKLNRDQVIQILPNFNHRDYWVRDWQGLKDRSCLN